MSCLMSCCSALTCGLCSSMASGISKHSARLAYCGIFAISLITSFVLRELGAPLLEKIPWINTSHNYSKAWFETDAVLRVSLGNFLFFAMLAVIMIGVKDKNDRRDSWHHGGWIFKIVIWGLLTVLTFFIPNIVITIYGFISKFGAGLFLLIQVIILLDFTHSLNDVLAEKDDQRWYMALFALSVVCFVGSIVLSVALLHWFNPSKHSCDLNVFFIVTTILLPCVMAAVSQHPQVNGSIFPASVISLYCAYVCYTGLSSEPQDYTCNGLHRSKAVSTNTLILGMITTILSVLYSALRAGSSSTFLPPPSSSKSSDNEPLLESDGVSYSYTFFHMIFAIASMYSAMLLSGWTNNSESSDLIDVGWTSVWVRICTEWATAGLYIWTLIAPLVFPDREF